MPIHPVVAEPHFPCKLDISLNQQNRSVLEHQDTTQSLYDRVGGQEAVHAAVDLFYQKMLDDERVAYLFEGISLDDLKHHQELFLIYAFGGPHTHTGQSLRNAHLRLQLTPEDFDITAIHLQETLEHLKLAPAIVAEIMAVVGSTRDDILNL